MCACTFVAILIFCLPALMLPVVWFIVERRRRRDKTEIIQEDDFDDEL